MHTHPTEPAPVPLIRAAAVPALCGAMAVAAVVLAVALAPIGPPSDRLHLPWWLLALAFAATELGVVHIHVRGSSHSLTLGELPLVLGLMFASPLELSFAWVLGAGGLLLIRRELPATKIAFNIALFGVSAGVAGAVFHALGGAAQRSDVAEWAAVGAAAVATALVAATLVAAAMTLSGGRPSRAGLRSMLATAVAVAAVNVALGLAVATVLLANPAASILLLAPAAALFVAYRAYTAEHNRGTSLQFLYAASRALTSAPDTTAGLAGMLAMARETFRAELAQVWTFASPDAPGARVAVGANGSVQIGAALDDTAAEELRTLLAGHPAQHHLTAALGGQLGATLRDADVRSAMLAPLEGDRGMVGALLIADRLVVGGDFTADEVRLLETLAHHTGAALGQDRLGRKVSELHELQRELKHQAFHDALTGLANRLLFTDRIANALARRTGNAAVLYIDLDDFKPINDTLGHEAGDDLLRAVAGRLRNSLRPADTAARLGGDEFAVVLVDIREEHAQIVADRILASIREPYELAGTTCRISASIGVALADSGTMAADELVRNADAAMYVCKHNGKRGVARHQAAAR